MAAAIIVLLIVAVVLLVALTWAVFRRGPVDAKDIEPAVSKAWRDSGLERSVGQLYEYAKDVQETHRSVEQMLRVPKERAALGELGLETILSDQLPPDMFGIRERVLDGKIPDAHIKSTVGLICIDSKFPLDNYQAMFEVQDPQQQDGRRNALVRDVRNHLEKIADDYVCPDKGSAEFAFAYIPSEGVYYYLISEQYGMLREYTSRGVQVVSPLTLSHKIELIKTGAHAFKLSLEATRVRDDLVRLSRRFDEVEADWRILYRTHLKNMAGKAEDLDGAYSKLKEEFDRINRLADDRSAWVA